jgi:hypothetical protein
VHPSFIGSTFSHKVDHIPPTEIQDTEEFPQLLVIFSQKHLDIDFVSFTNLTKRFHQPPTYA